MSRKLMEPAVARQIYKDLQDRENVIYVVVATIISTIPAFLYIIGTTFLTIPVFLLLFPGIIIGLTVRMSGGYPYRTTIKLIPLVFTALVMLGAAALVEQPFYYLLMIIPNIVTCHLCATPKLTQEQRMAKFRIEKGLVPLEEPQSEVTSSSATQS